MDTCLDICLIILMIGIIILVGIEIVLLIIRAIIACKEDKKETVEKNEKEAYLVSVTYEELVPNGRYIKKLIYIKAVSPEKALKQAEEYFLKNYLSPALRASYKKGEYVTITKSIENCISIN